MIRPISRLASNPTGTTCCATAFERNSMLQLDGTVELRYRRQFLTLQAVGLKDSETTITVWRHTSG